MTTGCNNPSFGKNNFPTPSIHPSISQPLLLEEMCVRITDFWCSFVEQITAGAWPTFLCRDVRTVCSSAALFQEQLVCARVHAYAHPQAHAEMPCVQCTQQIDMQNTATQAANEYFHHWLLAYM